MTSEVFRLLRCPILFSSTGKFFARLLAYCETPWSSVQASVFLYRKKYKILVSIVLTVAVKVMNMLRPIQITSESLLHNQAMLSDIAPAVSVRMARKIDHNVARSLVDIAPWASLHALGVMPADKSLWLSSNPTFFPDASISNRGWESATAFAESRSWRSHPLAELLPERYRPLFTSAVQVVAEHVLRLRIQWIRLLSATAFTQHTVSIA